MREIKYFFFFCANGRKNKVVDIIITRDKTLFDNFDSLFPYDVIDADDYHIWFDYCDE